MPSRFHVAGLTLFLSGCAYPSPGAIQTVAIPGVVGAPYVGVAPDRTPMRRQASVLKPAPATKAVAPPSKPKAPVPISG